MTFQEHFIGELYTVKDLIIVKEDGVCTVHVHACIYYGKNAVNVEVELIYVRYIEVSSITFTTELAHLPGAKFLQEEEEFTILPFTSNVYVPFRGL